VGLQAAEALLGLQHCGYSPSQSHPCIAPTFDIAADLPQHGHQTLDRVGAAVGLLPWALFVLIAGKGAVVSSVRDLESFQDSGNPGYFLIKIALWVMAALVLGQSLVDIFRPLETDDT